MAALPGMTPQQTQQAAVNTQNFMRRQGQDPRQFGYGPPPSQAFPAPQQPGGPPRMGGGFPMPQQPGGQPQFDQAGANVRNLIGQQRRVATNAQRRAGQGNMMAAQFQQNYANMYGQR